MPLDLATRFRKTTNSPHFLVAGDAGAIGHYLDAVGYREENETIVSAESAGEGNMNATLRVVTTQRTFILKQSRPWVAKFPQLDAPVERILVERDFAEATAGVPGLSGRMPKVLLADPKNFVLLIEDLGPASELSTIYADGRLLSREDLEALLDYAATLHRLQPRGFPLNQQLKSLNHAHIFDLPFRPDNGFPLEEMHPGLGAIARPYQHDEQLRSVVSGLGELYMATGEQLIHGDFYPGSFLKVKNKVFVIDAEFAYLGRPEFDLGVLMAHLIMARTPEERLHQLDTDYDRIPGFDSSLSRQFCYVEIMRRLIGIAQLPLALSLDERQLLLERSRAGLCM